uniref:Uncharacterized protein n=1 Tax=Avena sativa TaxID=4498 RepID=A0ACD5WYT2_AVESA
MTKPPVAERPRLTLEDYILFFTTHSGGGLTIDLLNQILFMHGFTKFYRSNKAVIVDALNSIDLLRPRRSTVSINAAAPPPRAAAPSAAELSTEDVKRDIEDLGWRACPVGSVLSIRARATPVPLATIPPGSAAVQRAPPPSVLGASSVLPPLAAGKRKQRAPRGRGKVATKKMEKRMMDLLTLPSVEDMSAEVQGEASIASAIV